MAPSITARANYGSELVRRSFPITAFEFRDDSAEFNFEGVASVVDRAYDVNDQWGTFSETIRSGAFNKAIKDYSKRAQDDVFLFVNHRHQDVPMASRNAGTLKLSADPNLRAAASLDMSRSDVQIARSAVTRGEMTQMSIGFTVNKARDEWNDDYTQRVIHEVNLKEVSIVPIGANPYTSASMRSYNDFMRSLTDVQMTEAEMRRACRALEKRFADVWNSDLEEALCDALCAALMCTEDECEIEDFNDVSVVYCCAGGCFQVPYTLDGNNVPVLDMSNPVPVIEQTLYVPLRSQATDYELRTRARRRAEETEIEAQRLLLSL